MQPLFITYVPALDRRRVSAEHTPFVHSLLERFPEIELRTLPTTELLPTMITGVLPHQHQLWQVSLNRAASKSPLSRALDRLPDLITTTLQCFRHMTDPAYDLPAVPRWRRRQWNLHRMKYTRRQANGTQVLDTIGGFPSLFNLVPGSRYHFAKTFEDAASLAAQLPSDGTPLEFFEYYALDLFSHWNLDRMDDVLAKAKLVDDHLQRLEQQCRDRGVRFALLIDHGQEAVQRKVDLRRILASAGVPRDEFLYFSEVATARLWFFTDRARRQVIAKLREAEHLTVLHRTEMEQYGVAFPDDTFGEYYVIADHGAIFFPHDFYQPLANLYMAMKDPGQRSRGFNPIHRGYHGHLPGHPADTGYFLVADDTLTPARRHAELIDLAPTMLNLVGATAPSHMLGTPLYTSATMAVA